MTPPRTKAGWRARRATPSGRGFLAECFWPGVTVADLAGLDARARRLDAKRSDRAVRYRGALLLPGDEVVFCFFDGPSAEAVKDAATRARIPFERILESIGIGDHKRSARPRPGC